MSNKTTILVTVISDNICPWCYIGKRGLDKAIQSLPEFDFKVTWKPFFLDPTRSKEGVPLSSLRKKFPNFDEMSKIIRDRGAQVGIKFTDERMVSNTMDSHRLVALGQRHGKQDSVINSLFKEFFENGTHIGDNSNLARIGAEAIGQDEATILKFLESNELRDEVQQEVDSLMFNRPRGFSGVPHFIVTKQGDTKQRTLSGGQDCEAFVSLFKSL
eukprot:TRINITY_DN4030_c0_g1_i1.p1 TRINITY_DN4030_c0_g1~~TRINITY_DN4030_c0_g1_i1.p1  ORF type:complete len:215 (+),score=46.49 TRINITY_DN4030_c0_g1_i1:608-1252(+)